MWTIICSLSTTRPIERVKWSNSYKNTLKTIRYCSNMAWLLYCHWLNNLWVLKPCVSVFFVCVCVHMCVFMCLHMDSRVWSTCVHGHMCFPWKVHLFWNRAGRTRPRPQALLSHLPREWSVPLGRNHLFFFISSFPTHFLGGFAFHH